MSHQAAFDKVLRQIKAMDPVSMARNSGSEYKENHFEIGFFNRIFLVYYPEIRIAEYGVDGVPSTWIQLTLLHYLAQANGIQPATFKHPVDNVFSEEWITSRQLPNAPAGQRFQQMAINPLIEAFGEDADGFKEACLSLGGSYIPNSGADAAFSFLSLPRIPIAIILYLGEEDIPPSVEIFFDANVSSYLPTEDLSLIGTYLSVKLQEHKGFKSPSSTYLF